ncbi:MAG: hypothetical protein R3279_07010 [Putridiphycobacter sp.]|nr:hypothetical protein [Putridiphycobacter sp.]
MALLKKYYGPFLLLLTCLIWISYKAYQTVELKSLFRSPKEKDIYIFHFESVYAPYQLDTFTADSLFFFSYPYEFSQFIPTISQIEQDSFNHNIYYIYSRSEINKLWDDSKIAKIYR